MKFEIVAKSFAEFQYKYQKAVEAGKIFATNAQKWHKENIKPLKQKQNEKEYFGPEEVPDKKTISTT